MRVVLLIAYENWLPLVDLDANRDGAVTGDEVRARVRRLGAYARRWIEVVADGAPCPGEAAGAGVATRLGAAYVSVELVHRCPAPVRTLRLVAAVLAREHPGHRTLATVRDGTSIWQHVFGPGTETFEIRPTARGTSRLQAVREFVWLGVEHIFTGYDHVCFLLALLLVAPGLGDVFKIVTAFTAAHTLTLIAATLGWVTLDVRLVESVIALSIAYVGVENLVGGPGRRRWLVAFGFGLVHGFGFSNVLREMRIPPGVLGWSLASFNVGVELGQLAIVSLVYPALRLVRRRPWAAWVVRGGSAAIVLAGLYWFFVRALLPG